MPTGSRDSKLALWRVEMAESDPTEISTLPSTSTGIPVPDYAITTPVVSRFCEKAQKVRALAYNDDRKVRLYDSWMLQESLLMRKCRGRGMYI